jgi:alpha-tubulin suppressor-like RCC1 family protein
MDSRGHRAPHWKAHPLAHVAVAGLVVSCGAPPRPTGVSVTLPAAAAIAPARVERIAPNPRASGSAPIAVAAPPIITRLSTSDPDCGLDAEGRVWTWANGEMESAVPSIRGAVSIACGGSHSCAVAADGGAWCWGNNSYGALGDGTEEAHDDPVRVAGISSVAELSVDYGRTCARTTNGDVFCWGDSEFGKAGDGRMPDNVGREKRLPGKAILTGAATLTVAMVHACSAMPDGRLSCWGQNNAGACGQPLRIRYVPRPAFAPKSKDIVAASAGESATCTLDSQGKVACWGNSLYGMLGPSGPTDDSPRDSPASIPLPSSAAEITVGDGGHGCARLATGAVFCWGHNENGQLGDGTKVDRKTPVSVKGIGKATRIAAGLSTTCALVEGGRVMCWGKDMRRRDPGSALEDAPTPVEIPRNQRTN